MSWTAAWGSANRLNLGRSGSGQCLNGLSTSMCVTMRLTIFRNINVINCVYYIFISPLLQGPQNGRPGSLSPLYPHNMWSRSGEQVVSGPRAPSYLHSQARVWTMVSLFPVKYSNHYTTLSLLMNPKDTRKAQRWLLGCCTTICNLLSQNIFDKGWVFL